MKLLSVVIPVYNEENRITESLKTIQQFLTQNKIVHEIIIVDDGSSDGTLKSLKNFKNIRILSNKKNKGKGYSVKRGFLNSKGDYVLFTDADLSTPIDTLLRFIKYLPDYDIIIGSRKLKSSKVVEKQPFYRVIAGNIFPYIVGFLLVNDIKDTQCGFKLFDKQKCYGVFKKQIIKGFAFDVEILFLAKRLKLKIKEVGVFWKNDKDSRLKMSVDSFKMLVDLIRIRTKDYF